MPQRISRPGKRRSWRWSGTTSLLLHEGRAAEALERTAPEPGEVWRWVTWTWLHWYVALRAEAAVLAESADARPGCPYQSTRTTHLTPR